EDAKTALLVKTRPAQSAYIAAIGKLGSHFSEEAREMAKQSAAGYRRSVGAFVIVALLCLAGACAVALVISRGLRRQLGGEPGYAGDVGRQVAGGDLTVDVRLDSGDRTSLLSAMQEMIANLRAMV